MPNMTEQNTPSAPVEEPTTAVERPQQPEPKGHREKRTGPILECYRYRLGNSTGSGALLSWTAAGPVTECGEYCAARAVSGTKTDAIAGKQQLESLLQQQGKRWSRQKINKPL